MKTRISDNTYTKLRAVILAGLIAVALVLPARICEAALFSAGPKIGPGEAVVPFVTRDLEGNEINLADFIGEKAILLDFWSIYCGPCVEEMPTLIELYDKYNDMGLEVFGISLDSRFNARRLGKFVDSYKRDIPYPIIHDAQSEIRGLYGVSTLPTAILVDKNGKVHLFFMGFAEDELEAAVRQVLQ
jgi:thiol-disulfide isomerase/thioredoxin